LAEEGDEGEEGEGQDGDQDFFEGYHCVRLTITSLCFGSEARGERVGCEEAGRCGFGGTFFSTPLADQVVPAAPKAAQIWQGRLRTPCRAHN
jgi:hypothetical protein